MRRVRRRSACRARRRSSGSACTRCSTAARRSTGIVASDERGEFHAHRGLGLVSDVFDDAELERPPGHARDRAQPLLDVGQRHAREHPAAARRLPRRHRWRSPTTATWSTRASCAQALEASGSIFQTTLDTEIFLHLMALSRQRRSVEDALIEAARQVRGAYALRRARPATRVLAMRDPHGFRPLCIGRLGDGYVVASETCALDLVGAELPARGRARRAGARSTRRACARAARCRPPTPPQHCIFEHIYFSRPDSRVFGETRRPRAPAHRPPARRRSIRPTPDVVIAVPDSSNSIALGYARAVGHPLRAGPDPQPLRRAHVHPAAAGERDSGVRVKFNPVREVLDGPARRRRRRLDRARHDEPQAGAACCARAARARCTSASARRR